MPKADSSNAEAATVPAPAAAAKPDVLATLQHALDAAGIRARLVCSPGTHDDVFIVTVAKEG
jgi:hypothetical protein